MKEQLTRGPVPRVFGGLIEFWNQEGIVEQSSPEAIQMDILDYLNWLKTQRKEIDELRKALNDIQSHIGDFTSTQFFRDSYLEVKNIARKALEGGEKR